MTEKEMDLLLAKREMPVPRQNVSLVLSPDITRNAMRLKKRRRDRIQVLACLLAAIVFLIAAAGLGLYLKRMEDAAQAMRIILLTAAGGMGFALLLSTALVWASEEERQNEG